MRDLIDRLVDEALGSGDRIGAASLPAPTDALASQAIRLASLATSMHLDAEAPRTGSSEPPAGRASSRASIRQETG